MDKKILAIGGIVAVVGISIYIRSSNASAASAAATAQSAYDAQNTTANAATNSASYLGGTSGAAYSASDVTPYSSAGYSVGTTSLQPVPGTAAGDSTISALINAMTSTNASNAATTTQAINASTQITSMTNQQQTINNAAQLASQALSGFNINSGVNQVAALQVSPTANGGYSIMSSGYAASSPQSTVQFFSPAASVAAQATLNNQATATNAVTAKIK